MTEIKVKVKRKIIHDNDGSMDDAIAFLYAALHPDIDIVAITMAATGEAHGLKGAQNMSALAAYVNLPNIPVAYGIDAPFAPDPVRMPFPNSIRTVVDNLLDKTGIQPNPNAQITNDPVELMRKTLEESSEPVTILATGPLTNVALLIKAYPELAKKKIEKIVFMGGAYKVKGNIQGLDPSSQNTVAEWNVIADPVAADYEFASGIPVQSIALDATDQIPITKKFMATLQSNLNPRIQVVFTFFDNLRKAVGDEVFYSQVFLWDSLAAILCINPSLAIYELASVHVNLKNAQTLETLMAPMNVSIARKIIDPNTILDILVEGIANPAKALKTPDPVGAITHQFNHLRLALRPKPSQREEVKLPEPCHLAIRLNKIGV